MAVNNTPLAIGQKWKTRDGQEVEIVGYDEETNTEYVWDLSSEGSVTDEGYCLSFQSPSDCDLITLIQDEQGFIPWSGGECPVVDEFAPVEYKMRDCSITYTDAARDLYWENTGGYSDIIAYRVVQQEVETTKVDIEEEPKYTVEQVFEALDKVALIGELQSYMIAVKKTLNKTQDPEYNKYLELKAKFEKE